MLALPPPLALVSQEYCDVLEEAAPFRATGKFAKGRETSRGIILASRVLSY